MSIWRENTIHCDRCGWRIWQEDGSVRHLCPKCNDEAPLSWKYHT